MGERTWGRTQPLEPSPHVPTRAAPSHAPLPSYARGEACVALGLAPPGASAAAPCALLAAVAVNQDGRTTSLTAPSGPAQTRVRLVMGAGGMVVQEGACVWA